MVQDTSGKPTRLTMKSSILSRKTLLYRLPSDRQWLRFEVVEVRFGEDLVDRSDDQYVTPNQRGGGVNPPQ